jgi:glycosyltransferase involved in cell wall biosynthesis
MSDAERNAEAAPDVSLVAPVYNEKEVIGDFLAEADRELSALQRTYEIVCADDGSTDGTRELLLAAKQTYPRLRLVFLRGNHGQTAAFDAGIRAARGRYIVLIDADMQNDPADIGKLLAVLESPAQPAVVAGRRANRRDNLVRRISSRIANAVRIFFTNDPIQDTGCSLKAFRAETLKKIKLFAGMHRFLTTLVRMEGGEVAEVPVNHRPRTKGAAKYGVWNRLFRAAADLWAVRWMQKRRLRYEAEEK